MYRVSAVVATSSNETDMWMALSSALLMVLVHPLPLGSIRKTARRPGITHFTNTVDSCPDGLGAIFQFDA
jgi:hypothetical protein